MKNGNTYKLLLCSVFLYLCAVLGDTYSFLFFDKYKLFNIYKTIFVTTRNGIFFAPYFVAVGIWLGRSAEYAFIKTNLKFIECVVLLVVLFVPYCVEVFINFKSMHMGSLFVSHIIVVPALFMFTIMLGSKVKNDTKILRNLSTTVYLIHEPVISITRDGLKFIGISNIYLIISVEVLFISFICFWVYKKLPESKTIVKVLT